MLSNEEEVLSQVKVILSYIDSKNLTLKNRSIIINSVSNVLSFKNAFLVLKEFLVNKTDKFIKSAIKESHSSTDEELITLIKLAKENTSFKEEFLYTNEPLQYVDRGFNLRETILKHSIESSTLNDFNEFYSKLELVTDITKDDTDKLKSFISGFLREIEEYVNILPDATNNKYLNSKKCKSVNGLKETHDGNLLIPLKNIKDNSFNGFELISVECKSNASGTVLKGSSFVIGDDSAKIKLICEGIATALSLYEVCKIKNADVQIYAAISAYNVFDLTSHIVDKFPTSIIKVCRDKDSFNQMTSGDTGLNVAVKCAKRFGVGWITPEFKSNKLSLSKKSNRLKGYTDFNDLYCNEGVESVWDILSDVYNYSMDSMTDSTYIPYELLKEKKYFIKNEVLSGDTYKDIKNDSSNKSQLLDSIVCTFKLNERDISIEFLNYMLNPSIYKKQYLDDIINEKVNIDPYIKVDLAYKMAIVNLNKYGCLKKVHDDLSMFKLNVNTYYDIFKVVYKIYTKNYTRRSYTHTALNVNASFESKFSNMITYKNYENISSVFINDGLHFVESSMGSGKTEHAIMNTFDKYSSLGFKTLIIVSTKTLKDSYISRFSNLNAIDIDDVRDLSFDEMDDYLNASPSSVLVCTVGSLTLSSVKSFVNNASNKLLTISDEIATTSAVLVNEDITRNRNGGTFSIYSYYIHLVKKKSKCALFLDASINNDVISLINSIGRKCVIHNVVKTQNGRSLSITDEKYIRNDIIDLLSKNKKCIIACDSANTVEEYAEFFSDYKTLAITNDRRNNDDVESFILNPTSESKKYDVVIYSPLIGPGNHIESFGENEHFDKVYGVFNSAGPSPSYCAQMLCRVRSNCDILICYDGNYKNVLLTNYSEEASKNLTNIKISSEFKGLENRSLKTYETHKANVEYSLRSSKSIFILELIDYMKYNGFKFVGYSLNDSTDCTKIKTISEIVRDTYNAMPPISGLDCRNLVNKFNDGKATKSEKDGIRSFLIKKLYNENEISHESIQHFSDNQRLLRYMRLNKKFDKCSFYQLNHKDDLIFFRKMFSELFCLETTFILDSNSLSNIKSKLINPDNSHLVEFLHKQNIITSHVSRNIKKGNISKHSIISIIKGFGYNIENNSRKNEIIATIDCQLSKNAEILMKLGIKKLL